MTLSSLFIRLRTQRNKSFHPVKLWKVMLQLLLPRMQKDIGLLPRVLFIIFIQGTIKVLICSIKMCHVICILAKYKEYSIT